MIFFLLTQGISLDATFTALAQYGLSGIILGIVFWYLWKKEKWHTKERQEWRITTEKQFETMNKGQQANTEIVTALKTLLETLVIQQKANNVQQKANNRQQKVLIKRG